MNPGSGASTDSLWEDTDDALARRRYETILETIDDGIFQLDTAGEIVAVDDVVVETTGYSRDDLLESPLTVLFPAADAERIANGDVGGDEDDAAVFDLSIQTADGETIPCTVRVTRPIEPRAGQGPIGIVRDLGKYQRTARDLEEEIATNELLRTVIEETDSGVFVLDGEDRIALADETAGEFFGIDPSFLEGRDKRRVLREALSGVVDEPADFEERILATDEDGEEVFECHVSGGDDREERWLEHRSRPIESGQYAGGRIESYTEITGRKHSSAALEETEERFQSLVDAVEEYAIFRLDAEGHVISWNEGARRIKGYESDEILGEHFSEFYTEADRAEDVPERNLEQAKARGSVEDEGWRVRKDGNRFWANVTITSVRDEDGAHQGFLKVTRDMTDRHRHEQELESELRRILDRISDAFFALDEEFQFTLVNGRAEDLLGRPREELIGEPFTTIGGGEESPIRRRFETAMATQEPVSFETEDGPLDGWIEVNAYPSETGLSVYFQDVTDRKEREQDLERALDLLDRAERIADVAAWEIDPETMAAYWSDNLFELLELPQEELSLEAGLERFHPEDRPTVESAIEGAIEDRESFDVEARIRVGNGELRWVRVQGVPETADAEVVSIRGALQDVTDRKERERELETSNERLEQFAYAASHDLQEPLRMVSSYLQLIENRYGDELDADGREFLSFAVNGADRMRDMIEGLLEYSRIESRGDPLEPVDLNGVLADVLENLHVTIQETEAEITVEDLPRVEGDPGQLRQLFQNLLQNAMEYSGDDPPRIHVSAERTEARPDSDHPAGVPNTDRWMISVADEGVGIDTAEVDRIFDVFQSLGDDHGSGIGLALCKRIVERHGGDIWVDSTPGEGATFSCTLSPAGDVR
jgi:PAS domain S-box-containing protein